MPTFRPLRADEVECRIGNVSKQGKGLSLLLYKDARCDANILDETVGADNWQCRYYEHKGTLFCSVGIKCGDEWVWKDDAGAPSNMEAAKGEASDAFKRGCFKWGIGRRELYTAPFIWVDAKDCNLTQSNGKWQCFDTFSVNHMTVADGKITELQIVNEKTRKIVFSRGSAPKAATPPKPATKTEMTKEEKAECASIAEQLGGTEADRRKVFAAYRANGMEGARALLAFVLHDQDQEF